MIATAINLNVTQALTDKHQLVAVMVRSSPQLFTTAYGNMQPLNSFIIVNVTIALNNS